MERMRIVGKYCHMWSMYEWIMMIAIALAMTIKVLGESRKCIHISGKDIGLMERESTQTTSMTGVSHSGPLNLLLGCCPGTFD